MDISPTQADFALNYLKGLAKEYDVVQISSVVLDDPKFYIWSASSRPDLHHYGKHGLVYHTYEVAKLCLQSFTVLDFPIEVNSTQLFLAALFHDVGKMWDYEPQSGGLNNPTYQHWQPTAHKYKIHHITRSVLVWQNAFETYMSYTHQRYSDQIIHAILSHHGRLEYHSPVEPQTKLAWILHLSDSLSARVADTQE